MVKLNKAQEAAIEAIRHKPTFEAVAFSRIAENGLPVYRIMLHSPEHSYTADYVLLTDGSWEPTLELHISIK